MVNNSHTGCLILVTDTSAHGVPEVPRLLGYLQNSGFIGDELTGQQESNCFLVGEAFLQILTFMGCSPQIDLQPSAEDKKFCYVHIDGPWPTPQLRYGQNTHPPRCCSCKGRVLATYPPDYYWIKLLPDWLANPYTYSIKCLRCGYQQRPLDLNWRREAAFGQLFVVVKNIFPGEAVPVPAFLTGLHKATGVFWQYFYVTALNN